MDALILLGEDGGLSFKDAASPEEVRKKIIELQKRLDAMEGEKMDLPVEHMFAKGMYVRKLFIPKGTLLVGKIHKQECINIVASGDISIVTETGSARAKAGFHIVSPPGLQKVGYAHEDTVFTNIFLTDETDLEKLEEQLIWESYEAMQLGARPEPKLIEEV